jgi:nitric oxide reductase NorQ protein
MSSLPTTASVQEAEMKSAAQLLPEPPTAMAEGASTLSPIGPGSFGKASPQTANTSLRSTVGALAASPSFVLTPAVREITERAMSYIECGYAVHLAGPAGTGKTTLAFHIAAQLNRPVTLIHGNDEFGTSDLVGRDAGYRKSTLVDNYVRSVLKTEENVVVHWMDNRLTVACEHGHTLIYDEFNRTRPEANNTLLSILEEGILNLPKMGGGDGYMKVHPQFRAIFTSNPEEYAGVHRTQDALLDRLITIEVDHYDELTERSITMSKSGIDETDAELVVAIARSLRQLGSGHRPTIRACIALGRVMSLRGVRADADDAFFRTVAWDVFGRVFGPKDMPEGWSPQMLEQLVRELQGLDAPSTPPPSPPRRVSAVQAMPPAPSPRPKPKRMF